MLITNETYCIIVAKKHVVYFTKKMIGDLNAAQIENIIQSQSICRLGCIDNNKPYIIPISYYYDGSFIYCQSEEGKKITAMRKNANVCIQIDIVNSINNYQSVIVFGEFEELENWEAEKARKEMFEKIYSLLTQSRTHPFEHESNHALDDKQRSKKIMFRIRIQEKFGRYQKQ
jgi:nitroimidazol reductase NimA-like FMN-containing flavoprotein (pyridoxamine 5'-phosphate oxidase superfamily)